MLNIPWRYEFNDNGGYDSMSASYDVFDSTGALIFTIDTDDFDNDVRNSWEEQHAPCPQAEAIAKYICDMTHEDFASSFSEIHRILMESE